MRWRMVVTMARGVAQSTPAPDPRHTTVIEHVHVIGQVADHQERRSAGLADQQGQGARGVAWGG